MDNVVPSQEGSRVSFDDIERTFRKASGSTPRERPEPCGDNARKTVHGSAVGALHTGCPAVEDGQVGRMRQPSMTVIAKTTPEEIDNAATSFRSGRLFKQPFGDRVARGDQVARSYSGHGPACRATAGVKKKGPVKGPRNLPAAIS